MSTPFLQAFAVALVHALVVRDMIEVEGERDGDVVRFLAAWLHTEGKGKSLVSTTLRGLIACPDVSEVYVDEDRLKSLIDGLGTGG